MEDFKLSLEKLNYLNSLFDEPLLIIENNEFRFATEDGKQRLREKAIELGYGK
ncbi:hypothetical protein KIJ11_07370 [Leuconostoc gelidum subsp. gelidum]|uniref:Uncharacterized protein n=1 Tax=Leuconostoc gelidum subsp. gelidum TaxID=1607839 RepID=A0ABS7V1M1_LEUGE|nr:hypothetical protein [Leuconostoc gelidum]MBZ5977356.1 hypothetical protein [Leuconostoc gelidum subsp. gelidum]MBZ5999009.1 hypothetical protein [Leuconostoc gelidum subsp. gelidum]